MMKRRAAEFISTVSYAGYFPIASGTLGSLLGMLLYYFVKNDIRLYTILSLAIFALGFICSDAYEKYSKKKDPHEVIIDEFAGIFIVYLFIPFSWKLFIIGFFIYRLLDIIKPPPAKALERLPGGLGIMADDILVAIYTNLALRILIYFIR